MISKILYTIDNMKRCNCKDLQIFSFSIPETREWKKFDREEYNRVALALVRGESIEKPIERNKFSVTDVDYWGLSSYEVDVKFSNHPNNKKEFLGMWSEKLRSGN